MKILSQNSPYPDQNLNQRPMEYESGHSLIIYMFLLYMYIHTTIYRLLFFNVLKHGHTPAPRISLSIYNIRLLRNRSKAAGAGDDTDFARER
jgi:hypothetical protein